ncbi:MAG TPA: cell wall synthesis protein CwsA [Mycobacterium sp.]|nr:cell wall synthesis protein CwsA [Mycobacterium sp.]
MPTETLDTETKLTPGRRLTRGLTHTATGPVDVTRGVVGLGVNSAVTGAAHLYKRYRESRLAREVAAAPDLLEQGLASAQEALVGIPEALQQVRESGRARGWRPGLMVGVGAAVLTAGAAAFVIIRQSSRTSAPSADQPGPAVAGRASGA